MPRGAALILSKPFQYTRCTDSWRWQRWFNGTDPHATEPARDQLASCVVWQRHVKWKSVSRHYRSILDPSAGIKKASESTWKLLT